MNEFLALLRAVNVGGNRKLPMLELRQLALELGLERPRTYIQSGNLWFFSASPAEQTQALLETALTQQLGVATQLILLTRPQLEVALQENPFSDHSPQQVLVHFFAAHPGPLDNQGSDGEQLQQRGNRVYIYYPFGSGRSRLKLPSQPLSTSRNLNTLRKLAENFAENLSSLD